jgi:hypothetical protein
MRNKPRRKGDGLIEFLMGEVVIFLFSFFVEAGLQIVAVC